MNGKECSSTSEETYMVSLAIANVYDAIAKGDGDEYFDHLKEVHEYYGPVFRKALKTPTSRAKWIRDTGNRLLRELGIPRFKGLG